MSWQVSRLVPGANWLREFREQATQSLSALLAYNPLAAGVVTLAAVVAIAVFFLAPAGPQGPGPFVTEVWNSHLHIDTRARTMAYMAFLVTFALGALAALWFSHKRDSEMRIGPLLAAGLLVFLVLHGLGVGYRSLLLYAVSVLLLAVAALAVRENRNAWVPVVIIVGLTAASVGWVFFGQTFLPPQVLFASDHHYNVMFSQVRRLPDGHLFSADSPAGHPAGYGVLIQVFLGSISFLGWGSRFVDFVKLLQLGQVAFLLILFLVVFARTKDSPLSGRLLALVVAALIAAPWLYALGRSIIYANLSGIRLIMLVVAPLCAVAMMRSGPLVASAIAGSAAAAAILHNFESGIAAMAGLGVAWLLLMREQKLGTIAVSTLVALGGAFFVVAATIAFYWLTAGILPNPFAFAQSFYNIVAASVGLAGLPFAFRLVAVVMTLHSAYILTLCIFAIFRPATPRPNLVDAATAAVILVWMPYYIVRPIDICLFALIALYAILLAPHIANPARRLGALIVVAAVALPLTSRLAAEYVDDLALKPEQRRFVGWTLQKRAGCADGLVLPERHCALLNERAAVLKSYAAKGKVAWFGSLPLLTEHLSGVRSVLWTGDLVAQIFTNDDLSRAAAKVSLVRPDYVLIDDVKSPLLMGDDALQLRFVKALPGNYCFHEKTGSWQVFRRAEKC